jgi:hypothetical protein
MKRSDEIQALANRWGARAASILFPDQPGMRTDMGSTAALLREYAAEIRARERRQQAGMSLSNWQRSCIRTLRPVDPRFTHRGRAVIQARRVLGAAASRHRQR